ncbi:MAG: DUF3127 domain-containing protein, partial [Tannerellaceae bacterium]|nr:DUF3127 domain-containing protein [Tannerellaceae bacterium]
IFGNDKIEQTAIRAGEVLTVYFDIESREYNGRWFTNINAWKVERTNTEAPAAMTPDNFAPAAAPAYSAPDIPPPSPTDDLPF